MPVPVQTQELAEYPAGPVDSESVYVPAENVGPLTTSAEPAAPGPERGVVPAAESVHAFSRAVPPLSMLRHVRLITTTMSRH